MLHTTKDEVSFVTKATWQQSKQLLMVERFLCSWKCNILADTYVPALVFVGTLCGGSVQRSCWWLFSDFFFTHTYISAFVHAYVPTWAAGLVKEVSNFYNNTFPCLKHLVLRRPYNVLVRCHQLCELKCASKVNKCVWFFVRVIFL